MQVTGQTQVQYTYDNANRLTQIAQGSTTVGFSYDSANRRSTLTLPNGIVANYSFDQDSRLTGISYSLGGNAVGNLGYSYDGLGRRTALTGTMAATGFPGAVSSASYDAANELTNWNGTTITYDSDGNLQSDGTHSYAWDARNHLSMIDSGSTGSFVYDPFGRRAAKSIMGTTTSFFYDGVNPVQELFGTTPNANLLTAGVDEYFSRTDPNGARNFLTDGLGSTLALTDSNASFQAQYGYDPFGNTTESGTSTSNSLAFSGRESDGTNLYFLRARYYSPQFARFLSEDPLGLAGGINPYAYAYDSPSNLIDSFGLSPNPDAVPDCGVDCARTPAEQAAIQRAHAAFRIELEPPGVASPMAGRRCPCSMSAVPLFEPPDIPGSPILDEGPLQLQELAEVDDAVEAPFASRVLVPAAMVSSGGIVAGASGAGVVGVVCS